MGGNRSVDRAVFGVVFLFVFVFSYSVEIVFAVVYAIGQPEHPAWRALVLGVDLPILAAAGLLKRSIARSDGGPPRLWRWWWTGFGLVIADDAVLLLVTDDSLWLDIASSTLLAIAMAVLMMSSLNADPMTLFSSARRAAASSDWLRARAIVPLVIGTYAAYLGATVWTDYFNVDVTRELSDDPALAAELDELSLFEREGLKQEVCKGAVSPGYFEQMAEVIPLLLLTLGIEFGFFRMTLREPVQRAATAATVTLMSVALVFALSTLPWTGDECDEILAAWHEYLTFVVSLQAVFVGLATLVWLLVVNVPGAGDTKFEN